MKTLRYNQRVIVIDDQHPLHAAHGTVRQLRTSDKRAWVAMERELPEALRVYAPHDSRRNWVLLWPGQCEAVK